MQPLSYFSRSGINTPKSTGRQFHHLAKRFYPTAVNKEGFRIENFDLRVWEAPAKPPYFWAVRFNSFHPTNEPSGDEEALNGQQIRWYQHAQIVFTDHQVSLLADSLHQRMQILNTKIETTSAGYKASVDATNTAVKNNYSALTQQIKQIPETEAFRSIVAKEVAKLLVPKLIESLKTDEQLRKIIRDIINDR